MNPHADVESEWSGMQSDDAPLHRVYHTPAWAAARARVLRQLLTALIYEGVLQPSVQPDGDEEIHTLEVDDEDARVRYRWRARRRPSFARVTLVTPVYREGPDGVREVDALAPFLWSLRAALAATPERLAAFIGELTQTAMKDALARVFAPCQPLLHLTAYDDIESAPLDGHPYHPCYKSRVGFDAGDNLAFGPEFAPALKPLWLAVRRDACVVESIDGLDRASFVRGELGSACDRFEARLRAAGHAPQDYVLLPVHPWQWREQVALHFGDDLCAGRLVALGTGDDSYRPQQSIRTLANRTAPHKAYLKLALGIVNTSTARILAPHTVGNAPRISGWLTRLTQADPFLRATRAIFLAEVLGVAYQPAPRALPVTYGALACIWRESLHPHLEAGEAAAPFNALCQSDAGGEPLITPWIARYGLTPWLAQLLAVSVPPALHLLYAHGIALEAHAQNMLLLHRDGLPRRVAFRDFHDGVRFAPAHLTQAAPPLYGTPSHHLRVNQNSFIETDDPARVRDFFHDAFFFINLGELALFLADRFGLEEVRFWAQVRRVILDYQARFPEFRERFALFDLCAPRIAVEQLAKRRLYPDDALRVHAVPNPLAAGAGR